MKTLKTLRRKHLSYSHKDYKYISLFDYIIWTKMKRFAAKISYICYNHMGFQGLI